MQLPSSMLATLLSLSNDAVLLVSHGELVLSNETARHMLLDACPQHVTSLIQQLEDAAATHGPSAPCTLRLGEGATLPVSVKSSLPDAGGHVLYVIADQTPLEQTRRALEASNSELKAMARRLFRVQEDERRAISRDLHDDIGQTITAMRMSAHAAMEETDTQRRREDLAHLLELADQAVARLRDLSMLLRPPQLDALGLESALRWQAELIVRKSDLQLSLDIQPLPQRLDPEIEQACFRIAQEALTNVVRHSKAQHASLTLRLVQDEGLCLVVSDDGIGFDMDRPTGLGLIVMRERAQAAGGHLQMTSAPDQGTLIQCTLPCMAPR